jgi:hypothetical protein
LTVKQKFELIKKYENGESVTTLARDYGIGLQNVCDINKNEMKLMEFVRDCSSNAELLNCKSVTRCLYEEVAVALCQWFNQK